MARVLIPLPDLDFDVTEAAVPWKLLTRAGHEVVFATERGGAAPAGDKLLLDGSLGKLGPAREPRAWYDEMAAAPAFTRPQAWADLDPGAFDGLILPGGHAPGMRQYLGSTELQGKVAAFWRTGRPVGAICHGVLVLARAVDPATGRSVLHGARTTCLPKYMERGAWLLTRWKLGRYYRTYDEYVEDEVRGALAAPREQFARGPLTLSKRGSDASDDGAFVVEDGRYVSARWPGDAYLFTRRFAARL
jgi:putative intracellular protease/amidase